VGRSSGRRSAGILLFRRAPGGLGESARRSTSQSDLEVLLAHPGGPFFEAKDLGAWTIPKGEFGPGEEDLAVARREFEEETGHAAPDDKEPIPLGEITQKGGKVVIAWALEGDLDPATAASNTFALEWPPRSGRFVDTPEIDRVEWFPTDVARQRIKETQVPLIDRLEAALAGPGRGSPADWLLETVDQ
jgi:predicted NUDIX family NTP pyrophosphohydrolase